MFFHVLLLELVGVQDSPGFPRLAEVGVQDSLSQSGCPGFQDCPGLCMGVEVRGGSGIESQMTIYFDFI